MRTSSVGLVLCVLALGCGDASTGLTEATATPSVSVGSVKVTRKNVVEGVFGTGTIAAEKTSEIGPRVDGIVDEIYVKVGDRVDAGSPLFRTRQVDYEIRAREAEHARRLARAQGDKAKRDLERTERLHRQGAASDERLDQVRTAHEIAASRLAVANSALARAQQNLEDTIVTAPYAGVITRRYVDEGTMMRTMMSSASLVVEIMKTDIVVAIVQIPELHLPRVHVRTPARVYIDGVGKVYESFVYILNDRVDHRSRAFEVRLPILNPDLVIKPGLFARAELLPEPHEVRLIDRRAVLGVEGHRYVFIAVDGKAERRPVRARELDTTHLEVLEGLAPGDRVLAGPSLSLVADGTPVTLEIAGANR